MPQVSIAHGNNQKNFAGSQGSYVLEFFLDVLYPRLGLSATFSYSAYTFDHTHIIELHKVMATCHACVTDWILYLQLVGKEVSPEEVTTRLSFCHPIIASHGDSLVLVPAAAFCHTHTLYHTYYSV